MDKSQSIKILEAGVRKYAPVVAEFFAKEDTILDYSKSLYDYSVDKIYQKRQERLARAIEKFIQELFSKEIQVNPPLVTNIVDHHAILNHPLLLANNMVANACRLINNKEKNREPIVVLTSSIVPPNNFFNRKGFQYHDKRVPLFSNKEMHQASFFIGLHDFHFTKRLKNIDQWPEFNQEEQQFLLAIEKEITHLDFSQARDYKDQISIIDAFLWKRLFQENMREKIPDLYYVPQEEMMWRLLPSCLQEENIVSRAVFDDHFRPMILDNFRGITGCWEEGRNKGTHFFWYKDEKNEAKRLYLNNNVLISEDGSKDIKLNKQEIISLIENKEIIPNLFVIFGYLTFWWGG